MRRPYSAELRRLRRAPTDQALRENSARAGCWTSCAARRIGTGRSRAHRVRGGSKIGFKRTKTLFVTLNRSGFPGPIEAGAPRASDLHSLRNTTGLAADFMSFAVRGSNPRSAARIDLRYRVETSCAWSKQCRSRQENE
jgi:hypothetical protein